MMTQLMSILVAQNPLMALPLTVTCHRHFI